MAPVKTPAMRLREVCIKEKVTTPEFKCVEGRHGELPLLLFTTTCSIANFKGRSLSVVGTGFSKKEAMHKSSALMLAEIENPVGSATASCDVNINAVPLEQATSSVTVTTPTVAVTRPVQGKDSKKRPSQSVEQSAGPLKMAKSLGPAEVKDIKEHPAVHGDLKSAQDTATVSVPIASTSKASEVQSEPLPVGMTAADTREAVQALVKFCSKNQLSRPEYIDKPPEGPDHCLVFTIVCKVNSTEGRGTHKTKKLSKQIAAWKVLTSLKDLGNLQNLQTQLELETATNMPDVVLESENMLRTEEEDQKGILIGDGDEDSEQRAEDDEHKSVAESTFSRRKKTKQNVLSLGRVGFQNRKQKLNNAAGGPFLQELVEFKEKVLKERFTVTLELKKWIVTEKGTDVESFFRQLQDEMGFLIKCVKMTKPDEEGTPSKKSKVKETWKEKKIKKIVADIRKGKNMDKFHMIEDQYRLDPITKKLTKRADYKPKSMHDQHMVILEIQLKQFTDSDSNDFECPTQVGFGEDVKAATESCHLKILEYIAFMRDVGTEKEKEDLIN